MIVQPIPPNSPTFGIYKLTKTTGYGNKQTGHINGFKLDIYTAKKDGELVHKLFYLADNLGNWIKSKLIYFEKGKKVKVIKSERKNYV